MTPTRKKRLYAILLIILGVSTAATVAAIALKNNLLYFRTPAQALTEHMPAGRHFRLGGVVAPNSVKRVENSLQVSFEVTDGQQFMTVEFDDILPDLFRECQAVIAKGSLREDGIFSATQVLAKHDENYMPPEVAESLDKSSLTSLCGDPAHAE